MKPVTSAGAPARRQDIAPTRPQATPTAAPAGATSSQPATATASTRRIAQSQRHKLIGPDPLSREGMPATAVVGVSDQGIGLVNGRLHAWSAQERAWKPTGDDGIASIKLGANNDQVWARSAHGDLHQVDGDGRLLPESAFHLPPGAGDYAVSPTAGAVSFITGDGALARLARGAAPGAGAQALPLPPQLAGQPASLAQTGNGDLYLASDAGEIWRMPGRQVAAGADGWMQVAAPQGLRQPLQLHALREGQMAVQDAGGRMLEHDPIAGTWSGTSPHARSSYRTAFDKLPGGSKWNHVLLNWSTLDFFRLKLPSPNAGTAGHGDVEQVQSTLRDAMGQLSLATQSRTPTISALAPEAQQAIRAMLSGGDGAPGIDAAASQALDILEQGRSTLPRSTDSNKVNRPSSNTLSALLNFRTRTLEHKGQAAAQDPVTRRIAALVADGVHLPADHPATMILMGKVMADHAMVRQAIEDSGAGAPPAAGAAGAASPRRVSADQRARVTTLFDAGMVDAEQFRRTGAVSERLNAGLADMAPGLARALHPVEGADAGEVAARFANQVCNLRPGKESVSLNFGASKGFDLEGLWMFFNIDSKTVGHAGKNVLSANQLPIITPLATASSEAALNLELSRTEHGVQVVLGDASKTGGSVGARLQLRYGGVWEPVPGVVSLLAVTGIEGAVIPGGAIANDRSVALQFDQDDHGKAHAVIADLLKGETSLTELLGRADRITNSRGDSLNINAEGYVHVFGAGRAIVGQERKELRDGNTMAFSSLVVPGLEQLSGTANYDSSNRVSRDQQGAITHHSKKGVTGTVDFNHISVVDVSTWFNLPFGKDGSTQIQWKVPALLWVANHQLWTNKREPQDATIKLAADGSFESASVTLNTRDALLRGAKADQPLTPALFPQLAALTAEQPAIQSFLDRLNARPGLRPSVTLELTPAALAGVHAEAARLAAGNLAPDQARAALLKTVHDAMGKQDNLRIAHIDVAASKTMGKLAIQAFGPLRATRSQSHTFSEAGSRISVQYDETGAATGFRAEGKEVLGHDLRPNLAALDELR